MSVDASVIWMMLGLQAVLGFLAIIGAYKFISKDIESITIAFIATQALFVLFAPNYILPLVASLV